MNWLAHLFLSEPTVEHRLGNLLGDLVKGRDRDNIADRFQRGMECHYLIDSFTDRHPVVRRSKARISGKNCRYAGILIDVFYDYVLARNWRAYSLQSLSDFNLEIYRSFQENIESIPENASRVICRTIVEDWLGSYEYIWGIEHTLKRIRYRLSLKRDVTFDPQEAIEILLEKYDDFKLDFTDFFPEIIFFLSEAENGGSSMRSTSYAPEIEK